MALLLIFLSLRNNSPANYLLPFSPDELYGDFEDLETGEMHQDQTTAAETDGDGNPEDMDTAETESGSVVWLK